MYCFLLLTLLSLMGLAAKSNKLVDVWSDLLICFFRCSSFSLALKL